MKGRSIFGLIVSLAILGTVLLPAFAQSRSQRYPTNTDIQRIIREFQQRASSRPFANECCGGWEADRRTAAQRQSLEGFVRAWSKVNPGVTPFLGWWVNNDADIFVYPSNRRDRVCVIAASNFPSYRFGIGSVYQGNIRLTGDLAGQMLLYQKNRKGNPFLLLTRFDGNRVIAEPGSDIYTYPQIPQPPTRLASSHNPSENSKVIQQFNAAGCSASRPNSR